ncbi:hypothetical protein BST61_g2973 [Cercospora zeina]
MRNEIAFLEQLSILAFLHDLAGDYRQCSGKIRRCQPVSGDPSARSSRALKLDGPRVRFTDDAACTLTFLLIEARLPFWGSAAGRYALSRNC